LRRELESVAMKPTPPQSGSVRSRENLVVIAFTAIGGLVRIWSFGRIGLSHFDEGIYAAAGLWIFSNHGLLDLDPSVIAYAPPGFPFLIGLSYFALGVGDLTAILVSIVSGTVTIPALAWLARRTFGSGAGGVAAALAALSGAHVAFSRMALTDVSFLLVLVLALVQGQRFLERPGASNAILLGLAVGAAQLFKYNGWLAGPIVALSAAAWLATHPHEWRSRLTLSTWGWGLVAALVAAAAYWPWFAFVQSHGGYSALLAHQRAYLGGLTAWPGHLAAQLAQARALSGGPVWLAAAGLAAAAGILFIGWGAADRSRKLPPVFLITSFVAALRVAPDLAWWIPLACLPLGLGKRGIVDSKPVLLIYTAWLTLSVLTPFYHPYARLWLPLGALECVFLGGFVAVIHSRLVAARPPGDDIRASRPGRLIWCGLLIAGAFAFHAVHFFQPWNSKLPGLLAPTDSLKTASASITRDLPETVKRIRVFARPPVTFYLGRLTVVAVERQASLAELLRPADRSTWALLDTALVRQDTRLEAEAKQATADWLPARETRVSLSLPVLLDIDPSAASAPRVASEAELRLLRPKRAGDLE
jgi:4-amino-4-deoxy-L-arabinose transferase-like glycosyltransferase